MNAETIVPRGQDLLLEGHELIMLAGDWHGNTSYALQALRTAHEAGASLVISVGDFGYWPKAYPKLTPGEPWAGDAWAYGDALQEELARLKMELYWVDGNHEDFPKLLTLPLDAQGRRPVRPNIFHLPRGYRFTWAGQEWLALGGAASVDRQWRTEGYDWFPEEYITQEDVLHALAGGPAAVMLTHDSPLSTPHMVAKYSGSGPFPPEDVALGHKNQALVEEVMLATGASVVVHGHYHEAYKNHFTLGGKARLVIGLDKDGSPLSNNLLLVGPGDFVL